MTLSIQPLALASGRHPWRTIVAWVAAVVVATVAISSLLGGALTTEGNPTNDPVWSISGGYANYMQADVPTELVRASFGSEAHQRLGALERRYDPTDVLQGNR